MLVMLASYCILGRDHVCALMRAHSDEAVACGIDGVENVVAQVNGKTVGSAQHVAQAFELVGIVLSGRYNVALVLVL